MNEAAVKEIIVRELGDVSVEFCDVPKNNMVLHGVVIRKTEENVAPTIYYDEQEEPEAIAADVVKQYRSLPHVSLNLQQFMRREYILEHVRPQLVAFNNNPVLADKAYKRFLDLAVLYRVCLDENMSFVIRDDHLAITGLTLDEVHEAAISNLDYNIIPMNEFIFELVGQDFGDELGMLVATTTDRMYGAAVLLLQEVLDKLVDYCKGDFVVLPSSIHEVIAMPASMVDDSDANTIVNDVNVTEVQPDEVLSNHIYRYSKENGWV